MLSGVFPILLDLILLGDFGDTVTTRIWVLFFNFQVTTSPLNAYKCAYSQTHLSG